MKLYIFAGKRATGDHYIRQNEPDLRRQILNRVSHLWILDLIYICKII